MKASKPIIFLGAAALITLSSPAVLANTSFDFAKLLNIFKHHKPKQNQNQNQVELLFIQQIAKAKLSPIADKQNCYQLSIQNPQQNILYFATQPHRTTGKISVKQFLNVWSHNGNKHPFKPNVAIQATVVNYNHSTELSDVATFSNPEYNSKTQTLSYTACSLQKNKLAKATVLRNVNLFFDPFHRWPP